MAEQTGEREVNGKKARPMRETFVRRRRERWAEKKATAREAGEDTDSYVARRKNVKGGSDSTAKGGDGWLAATWPADN